MHESWKAFLKSEFEKPYFKELSEFLREEYKTKQILPKRELVFRAFTTDLNEVKVVIFGQDPYHTPGVADGLAFSNRKVIPPSLQNIYKEIDSDFMTAIKEGVDVGVGANMIGRHANKTGDLTAWQKQGVLLLNNVLTVEAHKAGSHRGKGWEILTEECVKYLNVEKGHLVFILWGRDARAKRSLIDTSKHLVIESAHPSPLSAYSGFFGSRPFTRANAFLKENGMGVVEW